MKLRCAILALVAAVLVQARPASGSDGRFFQTQVDSLPISIRYRSRSESAVAQVSRAASSAAPALAKLFGLDSLPPLTLDLERNSGDFERATGGYAPDWGAAIAFPRQRLAVFDLTASERNPQGLGAVVRHELTHLIFGVASGDLPAPTWFEEGLALVEASEWDIGDSWTLLEARLRGALPSLGSLDAEFPRRGDDAEVAYRVSMRAVNGLLKNAPPGALAALARRCRTAASFDGPFEETFGVSIEAYEARFSRELDRTYRWGTVLTSVPVLFAFMSVLFLLAAGAKKLRARRTLQRWAEEDRSHPAPVIPFPAYLVPDRRPPDHPAVPPGESREGEPDRSQEEPPENPPPS